ncbi:GNAT family N-acetyltransferase [Paenibacillus sp. J31TS4]|nr:GNAT family N-acetyltransferase [Paenibacillus sp. J31TS4]
MIRSGQPGDAEAVMPLLFAAIDEIAYLLTGTSSEEDALGAMSELFAEPANRLSWENTLVYEAEGRAVGFALCYDGGRVDELDRPLLARLEAAGVSPGHQFPRETRPGEYYLDSLAVAPAYQGRGIARELMAAFEAEAGRLGFERAALIVEQHNERARRLYEKQGYRVDGQVELAGHRYDHMTKRV